MSVIIVGFRIPSFSVAGNQYLRRHGLRRILSPPLSGPLKSKCNARPEVIEAKSQQRIPGLISSIRREAKDNLCRYRGRILAAALALGPNFRVARQLLANLR